MSQIFHECKSKKPFQVLASIGTTKGMIYTVLGLFRSVYFIVPFSGNIQSNNCVFNDITVMKSQSQNSVELSRNNQKGFKKIKSVCKNSFWREMGIFKIMEIIMI